MTLPSPKSAVLDDFAQLPIKGAAPAETVAWRLGRTFSFWTYPADSQEPGGGSLGSAASQLHDFRQVVPLLASSGFMLEKWV